MGVSSCDGDDDDDDDDDQYHHCQHQLYQQPHEYMYLSQKAL